MKMGNDIYSISRSNIKKAVFEKCLNEACRQWCEFVDEAPERRNGKDFAHFFYEVFDDKWKEYSQELNGEKYGQKLKNEMER